MKKIYTNYLSSQNPHQTALLATIIRFHLCFALQQKKTPHIICVGTDRVIGDCLGPLTGTKLQKKEPKLSIYGTLSMPLHANNISAFLSQFYKLWPNPYIITIDAALGNARDVGKIAICDEPLSPSSALKTSQALNPFGDLSITGIVHTQEKSLSQDFFAIRLHYIDLMAEYISDLLCMAFQA